MERHLSDTAGWIRWGAIVVAAAATLTVGSLAAAGESGELNTPSATRLAGAPPADPYQACLRAGSMTADRIEARSEECRLRTDALFADPAFIDCLRNAASTPDAVERWVEACRVVTERLSRDAGSTAGVASAFEPD